MAVTTTLTTTAVPTTATATCDPSHHTSPSRHPPGDSKPTPARSSDPSREKKSSGSPHHRPDPPSALTSPAAGGIPARSRLPRRLPLYDPAPPGRCRTPRMGGRHPSPPVVGGIPTYTNRRPALPRRRHRWLHTGSHSSGLASTIGRTSRGRLHGLHPRRTHSQHQRRPIRISRVHPGVVRGRIHPAGITRRRCPFHLDTRCPASSTQAKVESTGTSALMPCLNPSDR